MRARTLLIAGIVALDTSPVVRREQRLDWKEQRRTAARETERSR